MTPEMLQEMLHRTLAIMDDETLQALGTMIAMESLRRLEAKKMDEEFFGS